MPKHCINKMRSYAPLALGFILAVTLTASAAAKDYPIQLKVLSAERHEAIGPSQQALEGCALRSLDAYCFGTSEYTVNTMLVQENDGEPFRITCMAYEWSNCTSLPVGETFSARQEKDGFVVLYTDKSGSKRKELYQIDRSTDEASK